MKANKNRKNKTTKKILPDELKKLIQGLTFISETDAEFETIKRKNTARLNEKTFRDSFPESDKKEIEVRDFDDFFSRLTTKKSWFGPQEKKNAERFSALEKFMRENFRELRVFRVGKISIDIFVVGIDSEGKIAGIKTHAVET